MPRSYVPDRGDVAWLEFDPHAGHEQAGRRPAIILSPRFYNLRSGFALVCPITSRSKGYPFEVRVATNGISGVILADQVKSFDWRARQARRAGTIPKDVVEEVLARARSLLE